MLHAREAQAKIYAIPPNGVMIPAAGQRSLRQWAGRYPQQDSEAHVDKTSNTHAGRPALKRGSIAGS